MSHVDLSGLRVSEPVATARAPLGPRVFTAAVALLAFAVAVTFAWPLLRPVRAVPMAQVRAAEGPVAAGAAIAEAAGWIEPDPFPTFVRPLVAGCVHSLDVLEGTAVKKGDVLAHLVSAELDAAHDRAAAALAAREGELQAAAAKMALAQARLVQKAAPRTAVLDAKQAAVDAETSLAAARGALARARADQRAADAALTAQQRLHEQGSSYPVALARAEANAAAAAATANAAAADVGNRELQLARTSERQSLAEELLAAPTDLQGDVSVAAADVAEATAARDVAAAELKIAARQLQWANVEAPEDGIVLRLHSTPGAPVGPHVEPLLSLYDPKKLRARIDVPLGAVGGIRVGQDVELRSEVLGSTVVRGVVQRVQQEADLLKNTLQVKVQVLDPPPLLKPETLCRARFLGGAGEGAESGGDAAFVVPKAAVHGAAVFRFDPSARRARAVPVTVLQERADGVVVRGELSVAQRVILVPVVDGERVREEER